MQGTLTALTNGLELQAMPMIFAAAGSDPFGDVTFNQVLLAIVALLSGWLLVLKILAHYRRTPSVDETFATKKELDGMQKALSDAGADRQKHIDEKILAVKREVKDLRDDLKKDLDNRGREREQLSISLESIQRTLGRLEGKLGSD